MCADTQDDTELEFSAIYAEHFDYVWRCLRRMGVRAGAVEDAAQDVFVIVHRQLPGFEGRSSVRSWLFGILRRVAKDHRRRAARKRLGQAHEPTDELVAAGPSPLEIVARAEAKALLLELLETLDDDKREVFILAELEQMSVPEIASSIDANPSTVYSRLAAARKRFNRAVARLRERDGRGV